MHGILLVDKPGGATSADVVRVIKRRHRIESIGHLGTLDPMATGLLPLCLGAGTKIAQFLAAESKAYTGTIQLGVRTDTLDVTGQELERAEVPGFDAARLSSVAARSIDAQSAAVDASASVMDEVMRLVEARARRAALVGSDWIGRQPYRSLASYEAVDADLFVGRERLVAELTA